MFLMNTLLKDNFEGGIITIFTDWATIIFVGAGDCGISFYFV